MKELFEPLTIIIIRFWTQKA